MIFPTPKVPRSIQSNAGALECSKALLERFDYFEIALSFVLSLSNIAHILAFFIGTNVRY